MGTQQRSQFDLFTRAIAMVAEGRVGKIKRIQCAIGSAPKSPQIPVAKVPRQLDWDRWLGPAPKVDFHEIQVEEQQAGGRRSPTNCHCQFRWWASLVALTVFRDGGQWWQWLTCGFVLLGLRIIGGGIFEKRFRLLWTFEKLCFNQALMRLIVGELSPLFPKKESF